jgi:rod shape-determining protein MreD
MNTFRFLGLLALQVLVLNYIRINGYINPYVYILYIMLLPFGIKGWVLLAAGFVMGYSVDLFMGTPGLHTGATVLMAFMRPTIIRMSSGAQESENLFEPSLSKMGMRWFFSYSLWLVIIHHLALFFLESFSIAQLGNTLLRALFSVIFTQLFILLLMLMFKSGTKKSERLAL